MNYQNFAAKRLSNTDLLAMLVGDQKAQEIS